MPYCNRCADAINSDERYCEECQAFLDGNTCTKEHRLTYGASQQPPTYQQTRVQRASAAVEGSNAKTVTGGLEVAKLVLSSAMLPHFKDLKLDPDTGTVSASVNRDRIKCHVCGEWFCNEVALRVHRRRFNVSCEEHRMCIAEQATYVHAQRQDHVRCFVHNCKSRYRAQTDWPADKIERHVWQFHYPRGAKR